MAFSKMRLLNSIRKGMKELGYTEVERNIFGLNSMYVKKVYNDYFLTLGVSMSRYKSFSFTASFYLSKSTRFASVWGDIPPESYKRIGHFLTIDERLELLDEEHNRKGVIDAWWDGTIESSVFFFLKAINLTESRFLHQDGLFKKIEESIEVKKFVEDARNLLVNLSNNNFENHTYKFLPKKQHSQIPVQWFMAAEEALLIRNELINAKLVELLATDVWTQAMINQKSGNAI